MLGPLDRIIECPNHNEAKMYNVGAVESRTPWVLFTEAHVLPAADWLTSLEKRLAADDFDAATLGSAHIVRSRFSDIDARTFYTEASTFRELGLWRCFGLRGIVVRRQVLEAVGWFTEEYDRFCETAFAIRLVDEGYRLVELSEVVVAHVDTDNVPELARAMYLGSEGCCRFWANEPELAVRYFGGSMEEHCGAWHSPQQIRETIGSAVSISKNGSARGAYAIARQCLPLLPAAVLGWNAHALQAITQSLGHCLKFHALLMLWRSTSSDQYTSVVIRQYQAMRASFARLGAIHYYRNAERVGKVPPHSIATYFDAIDLSRMSIGFYPPEFWHGSRYCWSRPAASVKLPLKSGTYDMCFDIRPTGQLSVRRPRFFIDGMAIPSHDVCENAGQLTVRFVCRDNPTLAWTCDAFKPRKAGLPDRRHLGFAIVSARANRVSPAENHIHRAA